MLRRFFLDHPHSVGETYVEHARQASLFGMTLIGAGLVCLVHAIAPCLFQKTASQRVAWLHERMIVNRARRAPTPLGRQA